MTVRVWIGSAATVPSIITHLALSSLPPFLCPIPQHGDPFGSNITNTTCVYSISDYASTLTHPPLIGYSLDGFKLYGRYLDSGAPGATTALDVCGGHTHSGISDYHYHSQVVFVNNTVDGSYLAYPAGPYNCWRGNISTSECQRHRLSARRAGDAGSGS